MTVTGAVLVLSAEPEQAAREAEKLRAGVGVDRSVQAASSADDPPVSGGRSWLKRRRERPGEASSRTASLAALCREDRVTVVVACDDESARVAHALVDEVPGLLALFGVDAALRALNLPSADTPPGGSRDDVLGRTRFVFDAPAWTRPGSPSARLVIGPRNWDGRSAAWALTAESPQTSAVAVQVVDGGDFRTAPADLSISRAEWNDPAVSARFSRAVTEATTHVLQVGTNPILPPAHPWPGVVTSGIVLDVDDLMTPQQIDALVAALPGDVDASRVLRWKARTEGAAARLTEHHGPLMVTDSALVPRAPGADVLPLTAPTTSPSPSVAPQAGAPPLVVTARPDVDLGVDPVAQVMGNLAAEKVCRHVSLATLSQSMWLPAIRAADVVVDRVWMPGLGMAGVAGLAVGRVVIAGVDAAHSEAALVGSTMPALADTVRAVLSDVSARSAAADQGPGLAAERRERARQCLGRFVAG